MKRKLPDIRPEVQSYFDSLKRMLETNVKIGKKYGPLFAIVYLTPEAQIELKEKMFVMVPEWTPGDEYEKTIVLHKMVTFANKAADSLILCGCGTGVCAGLGDGEVTYLFVTMYMPGFEPWTLATMYSVVEDEIIYAMEVCSTENTVGHFNLPGLWEGLEDEQI